MTARPPRPRGWPLKAPKRITEAFCRRLQKNGEDLRAAVTWRYVECKLPILAMATAVSEHELFEFMMTGVISDRSRRYLENHR